MEEASDRKTECKKERIMRKKVSQKCRENERERQTERKRATEGDAKRVGGNESGRQ